MKTRLIATGLLIAAAVTPLLARAADNIHALTSVSVDMPFGDRTFPGGAAADAVNGNCLSCHSAGMVLNQPRLSRTEWQAEVDKMRQTYKAPIADEDVAKVVDYLAKLDDANARSSR